MSRSSGRGVMAMHDLTTCHASPWALVMRAGNAVGKRVSTRMAYLKGTIAPDGKAEAFTAFIMNNDMTGWTKHPRRVEFVEIVKQWRRQPTLADIRKAKIKLPVVTPENEAALATGCRKAVLEMEGRS